MVRPAGVTQCPCCGVVCRTDSQTVWFSPGLSECMGCTRFNTKTTQVSVSHLTYPVASHAGMHTVNAMWQTMARQLVLTVAPEKDTVVRHHGPAETLCALWYINAKPTCPMASGCVALTIAYCHTQELQCGRSVLQTGRKCGRRSVACQTLQVSTVIQCTEHRAVCQIGVLIPVLFTGRLWYSQNYVSMVQWLTFPYFHRITALPVMSHCTAAAAELELYDSSRRVNTLGLLADLVAWLHRAPSLVADLAAAANAPAVYFETCAEPGYVVLWTTSASMLQQLIELKCHDGATEGEGDHEVVAHLSESGGCC